MVEISTSILSIKEGEEASNFLELETAKTDYFHIDVMDGKFVEKNTYQKMIQNVSYLKRISNLPLDIHLMVEDVKVGISVKPNTKIEEVYEFLPFVHLCLIMTVEPGKGGQTFLTDMLQKIETLKEYIEQHELELDIEVDGGINLKTAPAVKEAGANILVAGTAIVMAKNFKVIIDELKA